MLLTLCYLYVSLRQWWGINSMSRKVSKFAVNNQSAFVLYKRNKHPLKKYQKNIENLVFINDKKIACSMFPKKKVYLNSWMPFTTLTLFPGIKNYSKLSSPTFHILIQADINNFRFRKQFDKIQITDLGVPIAWTAENTFSIVLETDLNKFSKLVSSYLSNSAVINDGMVVLQIETINLDGKPKLTENELVFKNIRWPFPVLNFKQWKLFVKDLRDICKNNK